MTPEELVAFEECVDEVRRLRVVLDSIIAVQSQPWGDWRKLDEMLRIAKAARETQP